MIVEQVGGEEIQLRGILQPGADPTFTNQCQKIVLPLSQRILYNGYNLSRG